MTKPQDDVNQLIDDLNDEADLCRNEGANDIATLLDRASDALRANQRNEVVGLLRESLPKLQEHALDTPHHDERTATYDLVGRIARALAKEQNDE